MRFAKKLGEFAAGMVAFPVKLIVTHRLFSRLPGAILTFTGYCGYVLEVALVCFSTGGGAKVGLVLVGRVCTV